MEHSNAKKEPPWLLPLPPMPRLSVSSNARARLSHRRPVLVSPSPCPPAYVSSAPVASSSSSSTVSDQSPSLTTSVEVSCISVNCSAANLPKISTDTFHQPPTDSLCNDDSAGNRISHTCSQLLHPNFPGIASAAVSHSSSDGLANGSAASGESPSLPALPSSSTQQSSDDQHGICSKSVRLTVVDSVVLNSDVPLSQDLDSFGTDKISCPTSNVSEAVRTKSNNTVEQESSLIGDPKLAKSSANAEPTAEETELEEGQLPGEWSGAEESQDTDEFQTHEEHTDPHPVLGWALEGIGRCYLSSSQPADVQGSRRNHKAKKSNHKKGAGSKKRAREKSKEKYNEKKRNREGKCIHSGSQGVRQGKAIMEVGEPSRKVPKTSELSKPSVDEGPEDGEILVESNKTNGLLSSLVEGEVGLWTTDDVDDELFSQAEEDGTEKKKRGPETAERKLKRRIAKRKRRAQKEREMGIRRPPRTVQSKPVKVLCTHYMKGRCAKGDQCTFSHDAVPLTKQEPCKFLMSNSCLKGDDCPYSHDLGAFPCKFFHTRGLCYDGDKCQFSHGAISEEALEKLQKRVEKEKKERINAPSTLDVPAPTFSTPLPPELDPDPLGWGNQNSYHDHEETFNTSYTNLDGSDDHYGDPENHHSGLVALDLSSGPLTTASLTRIYMKGLTLRMEEAAQQSSACSDRSTPLGLGTDGNFGKLKDDSELVATSSLHAKQGLYVSTVNRTCSSLSFQPPNERSSARKILEVSMMEGTNVENHVQEPVIDGNAIECSLQSMVSPSTSLLSPAPARTLVGTPMQVLRGRQLGNRILEHDKVQQCPTLATTNRQHTVESLLDEALRH